MSDGKLRKEYEWALIVRHFDHEGIEVGEAEHVAGRLQCQQDLTGASPDALRKNDAIVLGLALRKAVEEETRA